MPTHPRAAEDFYFQSNFLPQKIETYNVYSDPAIQNTILLRHELLPMNTNTSFNTLQAIYNQSLVQNAVFPNYQLSEELMNLKNRFHPLLTNFNMNPQFQQIPPSNYLSYSFIPPTVPMQKQMQFNPPKF